MYFSKYALVANCIFIRKYFGDRSPKYFRFLFNQGYTKQITEMETKNFFKHSIEPIPNDMLDKDIHIDIRLKSNL